MKYPPTAFVATLVIASLFLIPSMTLAPSAASARGGDGDDTLPICLERRNGDRIDIDVPRDRRDRLVDFLRRFGFNVDPGTCAGVGDVCPCFDESDITALNLLTCKLFTTDSSDTLTGATRNGCVNTYMTVASIDDIGGHCISVQSPFENNTCQPPVLLQNSMRNVSAAELTACAALLICNPAEE
ncbi:MAG: hypothetical protein AAF436_16665 [Myxococcota bacterium]